MQNAPRSVAQQRDGLCAWPNPTLTYYTAQSAIQNKEKSIEKRRKTQTTRHLSTPPEAMTPTAKHGQTTHTHIACGILDGAGIQQKLHAVRLTLHSGPHQRRPSELRATACANVPICRRQPSAAQMHCTSTRACRGDTHRDTTHDDRNKLENMTK